jgi:hypothetical protein
VLHNVSININGVTDVVAPAVVHHDGSTGIDFQFDAAQHGVGHDATYQLHLLDGFNFTGTVNLTVTGDLDAQNEKVLLQFENGVLVNQVGTNGSGPNNSNDVGDPDSVSQNLSAAFHSDDSTLDINYHTSGPVGGIVHITGVATYTYDTLV